MAALSLLSGLPGLARTSLRKHAHVPSSCRAGSSPVCLDSLVREVKLLSEEAQQEKADNLVELPVMFDTEAAGSSFDIERWQLHRSSSRYLRLIPGILIGPTTRRISLTVLQLAIFSALIDVYNDMATMGDPMLGFLPPLQLPLTPFELSAPVLGLLLVFRTDTANGRFTQGSEVAWEITASLRSVMRKLVAWTGQTKCSDTERAAALDLIEGCLLVHEGIMRSYLKGEPIAASREAEARRAPTPSNHTLARRCSDHAP